MAQAWSYCGSVEALLCQQRHIYSITADNGKKFAKRKEIAGGLGIQFYFAKPDYFYEKGANDNTKGLVRQYIPKGTDFSILTYEYIEEMKWKLNHRPRESLGFLTPLEYY